MAGFSADYPQGTGVPGPGVNRGGDVDFNETGVLGAEDFERFGCKTFKYTDPLTPDWETAKVYFQRKIFNDGLLNIPELGVKMPYWGFEDTIRAKGQKPFPSPVIRLRVGELAHVLMQTRFGAHTIHHHGIEPSTMNDGVGHVSFETSDEYVYQWKPSAAGTYFYHCHVNTVLHFKMGLYGLLVVDPEEGFGKVHNGATRYTYDVERFWALDDRDPHYHTLDREAGQCGDDVRLNVWKPELFFVNGVHKAKTNAESTTRAPNPVAVKAKRGQKVLLRVLNGTYSVARLTIEDIPFECVCMDGHTLVNNPKQPWSSTYHYEPGEAVIMPTAGRFDMWFDTVELRQHLLTKGLGAKTRFKVKIEYLDWVTKRPHNEVHANPLKRGVAETYIDIDWS